MDRQTIAVIDTDVETAISINSTLRNAGINVHIINPKSLKELAGSAADQAPRLILYRCESEPAIPLADLKVWADKVRVDVAILANANRPGNVASALEAGTFWFVDAGVDDHFVTFVRTVLDRASDSRAVNRLKRSASDMEQRVKSLLTGSDQAIAYQLQGLHVFANPAYLALAGVREMSDLEAVSLLELIKGENIKELLRDCASGTFPETAVPITFCALDGSEFSAEVEFSPGHFGGEDCVQLRVRREPESDLKQDTPDQTTTQHSSMNRQAFSMELQSIIASCKQDGLKHALLFLKPDSGRELSDSIGFMQAGEYSRELFEVIRGKVSDEDLLTPFGDAGVLLLLKYDDGQRARMLFDEVLSQLGDSNHHSPLGGFKSSLSAGCTIIGPQSRDVDEAFQQARTAFKQATVTGNSFRQFEPPRREAGDTSLCRRLRAELDELDERIRSAREDTGPAGLWRQQGALERALNRHGC